MSTVEVGHLVYQNKPFAFVLRKQYSSSRCDNCLKSIDQNSALKCKSCHVLYCNQQCLEEAWEVHKKECLDMQRFKGDLPDVVRLMARIIRKLRSGGYTEKDYYTVMNYRTFQDLKSHSEQIKADELRMEEFAIYKRDLVNFMGLCSFPTNDQILDIYGRILINVFHINTYFLEEIALGIYLAPSLLDHSCKPNVNVVYEGTTMLIRTANNFPEINWSKLRIAYMPTLHQKIDRQYFLAKNYYFTCNCDKCIYHEPAGKCPNINCINSCHLNEVNCSMCGVQIFDYDKEMHSIESLHILKALQMMQQAPAIIDYNALVNIIIHLNTVHPLNIVYIKICTIAFSIAFRIENYADAKLYIEYIVNGYCEHYGIYHPATLLAIINKARVYFKCGEIEQSYEIFRKAHVTAKAIYGTDHSFIRVFENIFYATVRRGE